MNTKDMSDLSKLGKTTGSKTTTKKATASKTAAKAAPAGQAIKPAAKTIYGIEIKGQALESQPKSLTCRKITAKEIDLAPKHNPLPGKLAALQIEKGHYIAIKDSKGKADIFYIGDCAFTGNAKGSIKGMITGIFNTHLFISDMATGIPAWIPIDKMAAANCLTK